MKRLLSVLLAASIALSGGPFAVSAAAQAVAGDAAAAARASLAGYAGAAVSAPAPLALSPSIAA
ncbi:MAG TPA: hypothetical protein VH309_07570, partial [Elusimicrobiota bacterium]|nr:hypothetical protein [Elusimicrobiota bacterium]